MPQFLSDDLMRANYREECSHAERQGEPKPEMNDWSVLPREQMTDEQKQRLYGLEHWPGEDGNG